MSSANTTIYHSAIEDMFKEMLIDSDEEEQVITKMNVQPLVDTPKRTVRIRKHNIFANDKSEFVICRRPPMSSPKRDLPPSKEELHGERQGREMLQRRERFGMELNLPKRRLTLRL